MSPRPLLTSLFTLQNEMPFSSLLSAIPSKSYLPQHSRDGEGPSSKLKHLISSWPRRSVRNAAKAGGIAVLDDGKNTHLVPGILSY